MTRYPSVFGNLLRRLFQRVSNRTGSDLPPLALLLVIVNLLY